MRKQRLCDGYALDLSEAEIDIAVKARSYAITSEAVDGMDVVAVEAAARRALETIAETGKPYFLECRTYRFRAHSMFDAQLYRPKEEVDEWREKGPIVRFQSWLGENGLLHEDDVDEIVADIEAEIDDAVAFAEAGPRKPSKRLLTM